MGVTHITPPVTWRLHNEAGELPDSQKWGTQNKFSLLCRSWKLRKSTITAIKFAITAFNLRQKTQQYSNNYQYRRRNKFSQISVILCEFLLLLCFLCLLLVTFACMAQRYCSPPVKLDILLMWLSRNCMATYKIYSNLLLLFCTRW